MAARTGKARGPGGGTPMHTFAAMLAGLLGGWVLRGAAPSMSHAAQAVLSPQPLQAVDGPVLAPHAAALAQAAALVTRLPPPLQPAASGSDRFVVAPHQILSWWPRIVSYPGFVTPEQAEHIRQLALTRLRPSRAVHDNGTVSLDRVRTSSSAFVYNEEDPTGFLERLDEKIAETLLIPVSHGENDHILRYEPDQFYLSHMDAFDPRRYGPQETLRMATMLIFLSDVEEGGETVFSLEGKVLDQARRDTFNVSSCGDTDFKYKPRLGDAVVFYSLDHDNTINYRAMHGGCPVKRGEKWVLTKWMHNKPYPKRDWR